MKRREYIRATISHILTLSPTVELEECKATFHSFLTCSDKAFKYLWKRKRFWRIGREATQRFSTPLYHQKSSMTALRECFLIALCISPLPLEGQPIPPKHVLGTDPVGQLQHLVSLKSPPSETASDNFQAVSPQMKSDFGIIRKSSKRAVFDIIPYRPRVWDKPRSFDSTRRFFKPNDRRTI